MLLLQLQRQVLLAMIRLFMCWWTPQVGANVSCGCCRGSMAAWALDTLPHDICEQLQQLLGQADASLTQPGRLGWGHDTCLGDLHAVLSSGKEQQLMGVFRQVRQVQQKV